MKFNRQRKTPALTSKEDLYAWLSLLIQNHVRSSIGHLMEIDEEAGSRKLVPQIFSRDDSARLVATVIDGLLGVLTHEDPGKKEAQITLALPGRHGKLVLRMLPPKKYRDPQTTRIRYTKPRPKLIWVPGKYERRVLENWGLQT